MTTVELKKLINNTDKYNFHSHTEYCDGKAGLDDIVAAAYRSGFEIWGVTPHSPLCIDSSCNMKKEDVKSYLEHVDRLKFEYAEKMQIFAGMEVDFMSRDFGPHIDYFQKLSLDYKIGSVHFVPNQDGVWLDCDGSSDRFARYLKDGYAGDLRYVVEKYFEQVLTMIEFGGFEILGHFDKIIGNAYCVDSTLEDQRWYVALIEDVVRFSKENDLIIEINTKAIEKKNRFFPAERWWQMLKNANLTIAVNSDCHHPELTDIGRQEALEKLSKL